MSEDGASDDEDWFEQGLRDSDEDSTDSEDWGSADDSDTAATDAEAGWTDEAGTDDGEAESSADWTQSVGSDDDSQSFGDDFGADDGAGGAFGGAENAGSSEDDGLFDEGFGDAFGGAGDDGDFAEEDFESEIPRLDLGIEGLDQMIQGGVPEKHLIVVIGSAGTGKTTFGLQFLNHGLKNGENAVFMTLEQSREAITATANEWGWDFERYEREGQLAVVDLDPVEMANSLDNIQAELPELIKDFGADRLVLDSVSLLEMMYDDQAKRRTEVFDFTRSLKKAGVTTFLTSEASESNAYASRHGIIEYLTDAVFVLQYVRGETQETRLAVEIQKIRNANHSREQKPYEMTDEGISVYQQANIF
ncbi:KaiC domain protein, AF_0351 family [Halovenus aranensis]|uniref:KaiC domain protein, AF_0351 family n=1 Tax=Halovenus aranensis TaxID=890420 RepID=A0A1G8XIK8_9EURY|nr:KaiC domain-containing protein [Halovenus aranensis]SDJ90432.1 KaiC domain protein, AF_0351 family [Halovenus aranensis]